MKYLKENYAANPGFPEVNLYLYDRYFVLSDQFRNTRRYVSIDPDNRYTFSDEFSTIILSAGAVFSSAMNALLKVADSVPKGWPEMKDYSKFLLDEVPDLQSYSVRVLAHLRSGLLLPYHGMTKKTPPRWWSAYNGLKHDHQPSYHVGNLENCLNAVGAVVVLAYFVGQEITDALVSGLGSKFDPANLGAEELLFPPESNEG
jgi:hypothetical protein